MEITLKIQGYVVFGEFLSYGGVIDLHRNVLPTKVYATVMNHNLVHLLYLKNSLKVERRRLYFKGSDIEGDDTKHNIEGGDTRSVLT